MERYSCRQSGVPPFVLAHICCRALTTSEEVINYTPIKILNRILDLRVVPNSEKGAESDLCLFVNSVIMTRIFEDLNYLNNFLFRILNMSIKINE